MHLLYMIRLEPKTRTAQQKLGAALAALLRNDPALAWETEADSALTILYGAGEEQLEQCVARLLDAFVEVAASKPQIVWKETIRRSAVGEGRYIRQTGGLGNYAHVRIRMEPNEPGKGFVFTQEVRGGVVPSEYFAAIEQGIREAMKGGVLAGYEIVDVKVTLFDGSYHEVDSNEMAFRIAAAMAFKEAARNASPVLLEPVMAVEVVMPKVFAGKIVRDLISRRGRIEGIGQREELQVITAEAPLSELGGYAAFLSSATSGRATWSMRFQRYEPKPDSGGFSDGEEAGSLVPKRPRPVIRR